MLNPRLELAKIKSTPTNSELDEQVVQTEEKVRIRLSLASPTDCFHSNARQDHHGPQILGAAESWLLRHLYIRTRPAGRRLEEVATGMGQEEEGLQHVSLHSASPWLQPCANSS